MEQNKYLAIGTTIAEKYEVIDILGEDEFEILYLVRDIYRQRTFFVLKELFLETFSSREGELVFTIPEALGVFHKRKKQIIEEINSRKVNSNNSEIKIYGYEDENNTIYTIMEFSNNASLEKYLHFIHKDTESLPTLDELLNKGKTFNYAFIFKILFLTGLLLGITFYAYTFFQKNSLENEESELKKTASENFPKLKERIKKVEVDKEVPLQIEENRTEVFNEVNEEPILKPIVPEVVIEEIPIGEVDNNKSSSNNETVVSSVVSDTSLEKQLPKEEKMLIEENNLISIDMLLGEFLDKYITASATSVEDTMKFYDKKVKKYFKFNYPSHKTIVKSQKKYNTKWVDREFIISDFKIVKIYQKDDVNYYDIKTTTEWNVSNKRGKKLSGKSRGAMTLKEAGDSFKITSIYAIK